MMVHFRATVTLLDRIRAASKQEGITMSEWIRNAVRAALRREKQ